MEFGVWSLLHRRWDNWDDWDDWDHCANGGLTKATGVDKWASGQVCEFYSLVGKGTVLLQGCARWDGWDHCANGGLAKATGVDKWASGQVSEFYSLTPHLSRRHTNFFAKGKEANFKLQTPN